MKTPDDAMAVIALVIPWMMGIVLAKGAWLTVAAIMFPPYAFYLVTERVLMAIGWVA